MVRKQIIGRGIKDPLVIQAFQNVDRAEFVPADMQDLAYRDHPVSIGYGQTISQPYMVAWMTALLNLKQNHKVLEIGTGCGYQTAILAEIAFEVFTIEMIPELGKKAKQKLDELGYDNIHFKIGNGYDGWPEKQPFDRIIVTAAPEEIPSKLTDQLAVNGVMVLPVGKRFSSQHLKRVTRKKIGLEVENLGLVAFVPMVK